MSGWGAFVSGLLVGGGLMYGLGWFMWWTLVCPPELRKRRAQCRAEVVIKYRAIRRGSYPWWPNGFYVVKSIVGWLMPLWIRALRRR